MFNLTKQERQAILFILAVTIAGIGINYFLKIRCRPNLTVCFDKDLGKLNLNQADASSLMQLPGIGEKLANRIIEYRQQNAGFRQIDELKNIKGITAARFSKLKDLLFVME